MKNKKILIGLILAVIFVSATYFLRNNDDIEYKVKVKNVASDSFEYVGIFQDKKIIINKTNGEYSYFPKSITNELDEVCILAIKKDGTILKSNLINLDNKKDIEIVGINKGVLELNTKTTTYKDSSSFKIPELIEWKVGTDGNNIKATFKASTDYSYRVYVLGKGGKLGISDTRSKNDEVIAEWEKPKNKMDSWLVLTK